MGPFDFRRSKLQRTRFAIIFKPTQIRLPGHEIDHYILKYHIVAKIKVIFLFPFYIFLSKTTHPWHPNQLTPAWILICQNEDH